MSTPPQPPFPFTPSSLNDVVLDEDFGREHSGTQLTAMNVPLYYASGNHLNLRMSMPVMHSHQPCLPQRSMSDTTRSFDDAQYPWHANQVYHDPGVLTSAHVAYTQMPNAGLWNQSDLQPAPEVPCLPTAVQEGHGNHTAWVSSSACVPGHDATPWDSHTAFDLPRTLWLASSDRQPLFPPIDWESGTLRYFLDRSHVHPSHATRFHYPCSEPSPSYQSFNPTSFQFSPHPMPTGFLETTSRSPPFYHVPDRNSGGSSRRGCSARAIEYNGLWIDEEELLKALVGSYGKLTVHQCLWAEDHSPCRLWIRGDKSSISTHIQKWHQGKPGGEKSRVDCRWSACGKNMMKESIARHIVNIHLGETWKCQGCGKEIVRSDAYQRHTRKSDFDACRTSGALITYSGDEQVINAHAALNSGRLRYADA